MNKHNKVKYPREEIEKMELPEAIPLLIYSNPNKVIGTANNFVRKNGNVYCDININDKTTTTKAKADMLGSAISVIVKEIKQEDKHLIAKDLSVFSVDLTMNYYPCYKLKGKIQ